MSKSWSYFPEKNGTDAVGRVADFIDTNIWVYAHTAGAEEFKSKLARALLGEVDLAVISAQILGEYSVVMIRNGLPEPEIQRNVAEMIAMCRTVPITTTSVEQAWKLRQRYRLSFWDCQMVAAAAEAGCERVFTEDLQHGQIVGTVQIVNPFVG